MLDCEQEDEAADAQGAPSAAAGVAKKRVLKFKLKPIYRARQFWDVQHHDVKFPAPEHIGAIDCTSAVARR